VTRRRFFFLSALLFVPSSQRQGPSLEYRLWLRNRSGL
jgi:hypothetical protein